MSHEQTITIDVDRKWHNIVTVVNGKKVSDKEAINYAIGNKTLGKSYDTVEEAVKKAKERSRSFDIKPRKHSGKQGASMKGKHGKIRLRPQEKAATVMREYGRGDLHSGGSGKVVTNPAQAKAIAMSEAGMAKKYKSNHSNHKYKKMAGGSYH